MPEHNNDDSLKFMYELTRWGYAKCHVTLNDDPDRNDVCTEPAKKMVKNKGCIFLNYCTKLIT